MGFFKRKSDNISMEGYTKLADNLYINQQESKIIINKKYYNFSDILSARIVEDGIDRIMGSQIGKTNLGVGINKHFVNKLDLEIKLNDLANPFISIPFLNLGIKLGFDKNSKKYKEAYEQAQKCLAVLELIINKQK